jgi:hypothetical protein
MRTWDKLLYFFMGFLATAITLGACIFVFTDIFK